MTKRTAQYLFILIYLLCFNITPLFSYTHTIQKNNNHIIHIVTLNPNDYATHFVKAQDRVLGREPVSSMAQRLDADIAINGGFFEMGTLREGMPSGTLIINGKLFGFKPEENPCLFQTQSTPLTIGNINLRIEAKIGPKIIPIHKINQYPERDEVILYSDAWGPSSLTPTRKRHEIAFNEHGQVLKAYAHGNTSIPPNGYVLSLPQAQKHDLSLMGLAILKIESSPADHKGSYLMGIPQLIDKGEIIDSLGEKKHSFYTKPHARTAIGLKADGTIIILVAEHRYKQDLAKVTLGEVKTLIQNNKIKLIAKYKTMPNNLTLDNLKEIVQQELTPPDGTIGLTIPELANVMKEMGCDSAINLDGGGSSTLWIDGKIINQTIGDADESQGQSVERPVSDALVFKKK